MLSQTKDQEKRRRSTS